LLPRISLCIKRFFEPVSLECTGVLDSVVLLCTNIAASCPESHDLIIRLVKPACLQILQSTVVGDEIRGNMITLLANVSMTLGEELRTLCVADVLLELVTRRDVSDIGKSVTESVIIYLHGHAKCREIDRLMGMNLVETYCIPLLQCTLQGRSFRGMTPYLEYTVRVFQTLMLSREYAQLLLSHGNILQQLLQVFQDRLESVSRPRTTRDARYNTLAALCSTVRHGLWPDNDEMCNDFLRHCLPVLLADDHVPVRSKAAELWAISNQHVVTDLLLIGQYQENMMGVQPGFWRECVLTYLFPFLTHSGQKCMTATSWLA